MKKRILYFDNFAGIAGDMTVAALIDLGVDFEDLKHKLEELPVKGYNLSLSKALKHGISGLKFNVHLEEHHHKKNHHSHPHHEHNHEKTNTHDRSLENQQHHNHANDHHNHEHSHSHDHIHRNLADVTNLINNSTFSENVKKLALKMFTHVAKAEAKIHDKPIDEIHFHEVGAIDSIVDILGVAYCFDQLKIDKVFSSPVSCGKGFIRCAHGLMPVPAPATLEILKELPVNFTEIPKELTTPTGAAIIKTLVDDFSKPAKMKVLKTGYGAGTRDLPDIPNMVRISLAEIIEDEKLTFDESLIELSVNIDDMNPEIYGYLFDKLLTAGALDVWTENIMMKKNRPAQKLSVLCKEEQIVALQEIIFKETSTFGIRRKKVERTFLARDTNSIETNFGTVRIKNGYLNKKLIKSVPEFEDCKALAEKNSIPLQTIYDLVKSKTSK